VRVCARACVYICVHTHAHCNFCELRWLLEVLCLLVAYIVLCCEYVLSFGVKF
jgi:hypothetical protein